MWIIYYYAGPLLAMLTAIGGVIWGFLKFGGKTALEQWLERNYKAWELEAEKPYKEGFRHLEDKLDRLAAMDETKFNSLHADRVAAIREIYPKCIEIYRNVGIIINLKVEAAEKGDNGFAIVATNMTGDFLEQHNDIKKYVMFLPPIFKDNEPVLVNEFVNNARILIFGLKDRPLEAIRQLVQDFKDSFDALKVACKKILGSDKL